MEDNTPRSRRNVPEDKQRHIAQEGGDEVNTHEPNNGTQDENRERMGVDDDHKTKTMKKEHRGTYP